MLNKEDGKYVVRSKKALAQLYALEINKHK